VIGAIVGGCVGVALGAVFAFSDAESKKEAFSILLPAVLILGGIFAMIGAAWETGS
jgi:uncharacterized membrane protein